MSEPLIEAVRRLCMDLPEVIERPSHGEPTWFVQGKKTFVMFANHHHDDRVGFWCASVPEARDALVAGSPKRFFVPPYVGYRGWLGVWLDVPSDWDEIADIVTEAYRLVAPPKLRTALKERSTQQQ